MHMFHIYQIFDLHYTKVFFLHCHNYYLFKILNCNLCNCCNIFHKLLLHLKFPTQIIRNILLIVSRRLMMGLFLLLNYHSSLNNSFYNHLLLDFVNNLMSIFLLLSYYILLYISFQILNSFQKSHIFKPYFEPLFSNQHLKFHQ